MALALLDVTLHWTLVLPSVVPTGIHGDGIYCLPANADDSISISNTYIRVSPRARVNVRMHVFVRANT